MRILCTEKFASWVNSNLSNYYRTVGVLDNYLQKAKKSLMDSRNSRNRNLSRITDELQGVQQIMIQNIDDVLQRGETLSGRWCIVDGNIMHNEKEQYTTKC